MVTLKDKVYKRLEQKVAENNNKYAILCKQIDFNKSRLKIMVKELRLMLEDNQATPLSIQQRMYKASEILDAIVKSWDEIQTKNKERLLYEV